jgi:hypothetical protein
MQRSLGFLAALTGALALLALTAGQALADHVDCGDTITQDTTLDSDVVGCPVEGITIGADNVTLDLSGHAVSAASRSIRVSAENARIEDGAVGGGTGGVSFVRGSSGTLQRVSVTGSEVGVTLFSSSSVNLVGNTIRANTGSGVHDGRGVLTGTGNVISDNGGAGVSLIESRAYLTDNVISGNGAGGIEARDRVILEAHDNTVTRNRDDGILAGPVVSGLISANAADRNGNDGIRVTDDNPRLTISGNHAWFNGNLGIDATAGIPGSGNWAKHNGNPVQCAPGYLCSTTGKPKK